MKRYVACLLLLVVIIVPGATVSFAESWQHDLQPYIWFPTSVEGTSTVDGDTIDLDLDAEDVLDLFNFALSVRYEAWKGDYGLIVDGMYIDLEGDYRIPAPAPPFAAGDTTNIKPDIDEVVIDLAGAYRFAEDNWYTDLIGGFRYTYLKQEIGLTLPAPAPAQNLGGSEDYIEPMFGLRLVRIPTERWKVVFRGDMSGFGIGNGSDLTWNTLFGAGYQPWEKASLKFGYRIYDIDYSTGSGADKFGFDARMQGPYLGASFYF